MYSAVMTGVAIGAILAPVATAWINGYYKNQQESRNTKQQQSAIERQDRIDKHKKIESVNNTIIDILYNYSKYTANLVYSPETADRNLQSKYFGMALLYLGNVESQQAVELQREIIKYFNQTGTNDPLFQAQSKFNYLAPSIKATIDKYQAELKQD